MSFDLSNQYVSQSFQNLVQISGSVLVNGVGTSIQDLNVIKNKGTFTLWEGNEYDTIGQWTDVDVHNKLTQLFPGLEIA